MEIAKSRDSRESRKGKSRKEKPNINTCQTSKSGLQQPYIRVKGMEAEAFKLKVNIQIVKYESLLNSSRACKKSENFQQRKTVQLFV
jgi:hypothetical protein